MIEDIEIPNIIADHPFYGEFQNEDGSDYQRIFDGNPIKRIIVAAMLNRACFGYAKKVKPILRSRFTNEYGDRYVNNGWEWVTYLSDDKKWVFKRSSSMFPETSTDKYFNNSKQFYLLGKKYFGDFMTDTEFLADESGFFIKQPFIPGLDPLKIDLRFIDNKTKANLIEVISRAKEMLLKERILPNLNIAAFGNTISMYNTILTPGGMPKVIDNSTGYLLDFRLANELTPLVVKMYLFNINRALRKLNRLK
jgi:hypothetical protein